MAMLCSSQYNHQSVALISHRAHQTCSDTIYIYMLQKLPGKSERALLSNICPTTTQDKAARTLAFTVGARTHGCPTYILHYVKSSLAAPVKLLDTGAQLQNAYLLYHSTN